MAVAESCAVPTWVGIADVGVVLDSDFDPVDEVGLFGTVGAVVLLGVGFVWVAFRATGSCGKRLRTVGDKLNRTILLGLDCLMDREIDVGVETLESELGGAIVNDGRIGYGTGVRT